MRFLQLTCFPLSAEQIRSFQSDIFLVWFPQNSRNCFHFWILFVQLGVSEKGHCRSVWCFTQLVKRLYRFVCSSDSVRNQSMKEYSAWSWAYPWRRGFPLARTHFVIRPLFHHIDHFNSSNLQSRIWLRQETDIKTMKIVGSVLRERVRESEGLGYQKNVRVPLPHTPIDSTSCHICSSLSIFS